MAVAEARDEGEAKKEEAKEEGTEVCEAAEEA